MSEWVHFALDNGYWKILISNLGNSPKLRPVDVPSPSSSRNENWRYFPPNSPSVNQDSFLSPPSTTVRRRPQARNSPKNSPSSTTGQNIHFPAATITPDTAHTVHPSKVEIRFLPERSGEDKKWFALNLAYDQLCDKEISQDSVQTTHTIWLDVNTDEITSVSRTLQTNQQCVRMLAKYFVMTCNLIVAYYFA